MSQVLDRPVNQYVTINVNVNVNINIKDLMNEANILKEN